MGWRGGDEDRPTQIIVFYFIFFKDHILPYTNEYLVKAIVGD